VKRRWVSDHGGKAVRLTSTDEKSAGSTSGEAFIGDGVPKGNVRLGTTRAVAPERTRTAFIREGGCGCPKGQIHVMLRSIEGRRLGSWTVLFFTWRVRKVISANSADRSNQRTNGNRGGDRGVRSKARRDDGLRRHRGIADFAEEYATKSRVEPRKRMERRETPHAPSTQRSIFQPKGLRRTR